MTQETPDVADYLDTEGMAEVVERTIERFHPGWDGEPFSVVTRGDLEAADRELGEWARRYLVLVPTQKEGEG